MEGRHISSLALWVSFLPFFFLSPLDKFVLFAGIGKTRTLQAFTDVCSIMFPSVVAIFSSCLGMNQQHPFAQGTLYRAVLVHLRARRYIEFEDAELGESRQLFFDKLEALDFRIVLIVDELDRVYKEDPKTQRGGILRDFLEDLAYLGEQRTGRVLAVLCGSSSRLPQRSPRPLMLLPPRPS